MRNIITVLTVMIVPGPLYANSAPIVSNVQVSQRADDSKLVDIYYDLADLDENACMVWFSVSDDGGTTWDVPVFTVSGDVWEGITPGTNKHIIWDAGHDVGGKIGTFRARIFATDGDIDNMLLVPGGTFEYNHTDTVFVPTYMIDKYEVTNQQYAEFLTSADPDGTYYNGDMEIGRYGTAGSYYYIPAAGKELYPVYSVSLYDAEAYAAWKCSQTGLNHHLPNQYEWQKAAGWDPAFNKLWNYACQRDTADCTWNNYFGCVGGPLPVGSFNGTNNRNDAKSYYGCYDMSGNLWEWTTEIYGSYSIVRGGGWTGSTTAHTVTTSANYLPSSHYSYIGFRLVLDLN